MHYAAIAATDCKNTNLPTIECDALLAIYNSTDGENWNSNMGWTQDNNPCDWYGIRCYENHVVSLQFISNYLNGSIPPEIGNLTNLTHMLLNSNLLSGSIPPEIGYLSNLSELVLDGNRLTGSIPSEIGNLSNLTQLYLYSNQLTGFIPSEIGNLTKLELLILDYNQLTGPIPPEIGNLANLRTLILNHNQFTGKIPGEIGNLENLTGLYIHSNQICGEIPTSLMNLTNLDFEIGLNINDNFLFTQNSALDDFLVERGGNWQTSQGDNTCHAGLPWMILILE